jgi:hypothetical protein
VIESRCKFNCAYLPTYYPLEYFDKAYDGSQL